MEELLYIFPENLQETVKLNSEQFISGRIFFHEERRQRKVEDLFFNSKYILYHEGSSVVSVSYDMLWFYIFGVSSSLNVYTLCIYYIWNISDFLGITYIFRILYFGCETERGVSMCCYQIGVSLVSYQIVFSVKCSLARCLSRDDVSDAVCFPCGGMMPWCLLWFKGRIPKRWIVLSLY